MRSAFALRKRGKDKMKENQSKKENAFLTATKEKGFINLTLTIGEVVTSIKVNDYNGNQKKRARALTYKIYKILEAK